VLLGLRAEAQFVDMVDDFAQVVAALNLVLDFTENLADLVLDGVRSACPLLEAVQEREKLLIDEVAQVVAGQCGVVVELAILALRRGPAFPTVWLLKNEGVFLLSSAARSASSPSSPSRYFRNSSQDDCSV